MKDYIVEVPFTGVAVITVQADNEKEAIALAIDNVTLHHIENWGPVEKIVEGNIFYGVQNEASATEE